MTISRVLLSGGTNGRSIKTVATATPGTLIHTAHATAFDEIFLYATNFHTADLALTIEWGGVTSPDDLTVMTIPFKDGDHLIIPGRHLTGGLIVRAFAASANLVMLNGYVNRHV